MLPKNQRLKISSEFNAVYRLKRSIADSLLILYTGKEKHHPQMPTKVGFVVSKKIHKRAVKRNRIKRLIRESYRKALLASEIQPSQKYTRLIFLPREAALKADYKQIYNSVAKLINKADKKF